MSTLQDTEDWKYMASIMKIQEAMYEWNPTKLFWNTKHNNKKGQKGYYQISNTQLKQRFNNVQYIQQHLRHVLCHSGENKHIAHTFRTLFGQHLALERCIRLCVVFGYLMAYPVFCFYFLNNIAWFGRKRHVLWNITMLGYPCSTWEYLHGRCTPFSQAVVTRSHVCVCVCVRVCFPFPSRVWAIQGKFDVFE